MLEVSQLSAAVALMPLFNNELQVQQLHLDGVRVHLVSRKDGRSSMDGLTGDKSTAKVETQSGPATRQQLLLQDLSVRDLQLNLFSEGSPARQITLKSVKLADFKAEQWSALDFELVMRSGQTQVDIAGSAQLQLSQTNQIVQLKDFRLATDFSGVPVKQLSLETELTLALDQKQLKWQWNKLQLDEIKGSGQLAVNYAKQAVINLDLQLDEVDTASYSSENSAGQAGATAQQRQVEPDLSALRQFDLDVKLAVNRLKVAGLHTENLQLVLSNKAGLVQIQHALSLIHI